MKVAGKQRVSGHVHQTRLASTPLSVSSSNMRRAQSTRHHPRPSLALGADDLGVLNESGAMEDMEDALRRQLLERDRLCSKVSHRNQDTVSCVKLTLIHSIKAR